MSSLVLRQYVQNLHLLIRESYDQKELAQCLYYSLQENLDVISAENNLDRVVFDLVLWADRNGKILDLARAVAEGRPRVKDLSSLVRKMTAAASANASTPDDPGVPAHPSKTNSPGSIDADRSVEQPLPDELVALMRAYERIRHVMEWGHERRAASHDMANRMKSLPIEELGLPDRLHLGFAAGERLAAIVSLEKSPDHRYFRWLAERPFAESRFLGLRATFALREAAKQLDPAYLGPLHGILAETMKGLKERKDKEDEQLIAVIREAQGDVSKRFAHLNE
jgi:hypothetical protein